MGKYFALAFLLLLAIPTYAKWDTYQYDLQNSGKSKSTGYFPVKLSNFTRDDLGMDFQPLVFDLNLDGQNDIVIFYNDSLFILDKTLTTIASANVGSIASQPSLFDIDNDSSYEIVFNARKGSLSLFSVYGFRNLSLLTYFNITLPFENNYSGIKCADIKGNRSCIFKDKRNFVHIIDLENKMDNYYNTSVHNETRNTVPAIGDIDNDGNPEAVFWFNKDNTQGYGFLVFDLVQRVPDFVFNGNGTVDNIFAPFMQNFELKGQPVLTDLDNDRKMEIAASVFYDDSTNTDMFVDWNTEIFVYNYNGTKQFSKCYGYPHSGVACNDGNNVRQRYHGSNTFVMDFNSDGKDEICIIQKKHDDLIYMALNCYNYSGNSNYSFLAFTDEISSAMSVDLTNDGSYEVLAVNDVFLKNGTLFYKHGLFPNPIAVDVDGNGGIDLLWTYGKKTTVFLDSNNYSTDISVSDGDIAFSKHNRTHVNVSAKIRNQGDIESVVKVSFMNSNSLETKDFNITLRRKFNSTIGSVMAFRENDNVQVFIDPLNEVNESDEMNNFASKEFLGIPYVYVFSNTKFADTEFEDYIKSNLVSGYYTNNEFEADVKVFIGRFNPYNMDLNNQKLDSGIGFDNSGIIYNDEFGINPYSGIVASFRDEILGFSKLKVMIAGNDIEGDIAATKEFVKNQALFLNGENSLFLSDENEEAIKVYDYLHTEGNSDHYRLPSNQFRLIVKNALNDLMFSQTDHLIVSGNNVTLRMRNLRANLSSTYIQYLDSKGVPVNVPVVLAHGLFSNLSTWQVLGSEISNSGRDVWLIEITGGPGQDCDSCIDYTFYNLTDIFVPALLNGVLEKTGKDTLQYVGFSNGCRSALDSLERGMFDSNKVETFVAVGCPGAFEGESIGAEKLKENGNIAISKFRNQNKNHLNFADVSKMIIGLPLFSFSNEKISTNLLDFYYNISSTNIDEQPGINTTINRFYLIQGKFTNNSDLIVTVSDENKIYENIFSNNKKYLTITASHASLDDNQRAKSLIQKFVNNETLSWFEKTLILKSSN